MTEERIKELAGEWIHTNIEAGSASLLSEMKSLAKLLRTVAAEARKEGIDEMEDAALFEVHMNLHGDYERFLREAAERLKEQGK